MLVKVDENPTRQNIITLLKKNGGMTIEDLSKKISITPMGIRQHLLSLEKKGLVSYTAKKHGIGRPGFVYMLTESADDLFPKTYDRFALDILREVKKNDGQEKINKILSGQRDKVLGRKKEALSGLSGLDEIVQGLKNLLVSEGSLAELDKEGDNYILTTFNCPIRKVAAEFNEVCHEELQLFRELLHRNVTMVQCMGQGSPSCIFSIPSS
ncbi:MAG: winged helix-turn-helix transcriptional regulator [Nitrospirota bacterium]|nr:winged helix-turn-helix transcriptional regulator [Nitrospirota bacterium]